MPTVTSLSYPASTEETLIVSVSHIGLTVLGKALSPTFVLSSPQLTDQNTALSPQDFGIPPEEWKTLCDSLTKALHAADLPTVVGILQWVPLVVFGGPAWINIPAERRQRAKVYTELARVQQSILKPRNLYLQLHSSYVHRGRFGEAWSWISISKTSGKGQSQEPVLVLKSSHPAVDKNHFQFCQSLYKKCEQKVNQ